MRDRDRIWCNCCSRLKLLRNLENSWAQDFERPVPLLYGFVRSTTSHTLDSETCEALGSRHLHPPGPKLRSATCTLRYNNYKLFNPIYRPVSKTMIIIGYFSIALIVFLVWFKSFWNDTATSKNDLISWIALVIGPLAWPVVLPLSPLQITSNNSVVPTAQCEQEV